MKYADRNILFTVLSASALLVAGCGGGGGSSSNNSTSSSDEPLEISSSNGASVGRTTATGANNVGQSGAQLTQSQIVGAADLDSSGSGLSVVEATRFMLERVRAQSSDTIDSVTGAVTEGTCPDNGSVSITETGSSGGTLEVDESWTATWDNCEASFGSSSFLIDGQVEFDVTACDNCNNADDEGVDWAYGIAITYTDWRIVLTGSTEADLLIDGELRLSGVNDADASPNLAFDVTGGPFRVEDRLNNDTFEFTSLDIDYSFDSGTQVATTVVNSMQFTSNDLDGSVSASTVAGMPFVSDSSSPYPTSGRLEISGANGSSATVSAGDCGDDEFGLIVNDDPQTCEPWAG